MNLCGEAHVWDAGAKTLYWADCLGSKFFRDARRIKKREVLKENLEINGCALNQGGGFVITTNPGIWLWDGVGQPRLVKAQVGAEKCRMNDCIADSQGRLLAGSWFYHPAKSYPPGKLFCVETDGRVRILDEGFQLANGLGFSPDGKTLYFANSSRRLVYGYDYDASIGGIRNRPTVVKVPETAGLPNGLPVDAEGYIWLAEWYGRCVARYDPDGKLERRIASPAKQISSLAFAGPDLTDIFITSAAKPERMPVIPKGYDPHTGYFGGPLFHVNLGIQGKNDYKASIRPH